jgi:hypothetical protein
MTDQGNFEQRLARVLREGASQLPIGTSVPAATSCRLVKGHGTRLRAPRRWGLAVAVTATSLAVTSGAAVAAVYYGSRPITQRATARCYTVDSLAGGAAFTGTELAAVGRPGSRAEMSSALQVCAVLWQSGLLAPGAARALHVPLPPADRHVPPLVVCTLPDGSAGVFPGEAATCQSLGLPQAGRT